MRTLVLTGATGFVGQELAAKLCGDPSLDAHKDKTELVVLTRNPTALKERFPHKCRSYAWQPTSSLPPEEAFEGANAVVHLLGESVANRRWSKKQKEEIYNSRILSSRNLVKRILTIPRENRPEVLVSASATGFYGNTGEEDVSENSPRGSDFLSQVCSDWEAEAKSLEANGVRSVSIRIGVVLGPKGGMLKRLTPIAKLGLAGRLGSGKQWMSWIHIEDLVQIIQLALNDRDLSGPINAVSPNPVRNIDFTQILASQLKRPVGPPVPEFVLRTLLGEMSSFILGSQKVRPSKLLKAKYPFQFATLEECLRHLYS